MNLLAAFEQVKNIALAGCPSIQAVVKGEPKTFNGQSPTLTIKLGRYTHHPIANKQATETYSFVVTLYVKWQDNEALCETQLLTILEEELAPAFADNKSLNGTVTAAVLTDGDAGVRKIIGETYRYVDNMLMCFYKTE